MADFIRDPEITALLTSDGPVALGDGDGEAKKIVEAMGGGLALVYDKEDGQLYSGVGSVLTGTVQALIYEYDFANLGGAVSTIELDGADLPANFLILNGVAQVITACTSGGSATITLGTKSGTATNLLGSTAVGSLTAGAKFQLVPDFATIADSIKETTKQRPVIAIGTAALTAGRIKVALMGVILA